MRFLKAGDSALIIELGNEIAPEISLELKKITEFIDSQKLKGIRDILPTYRSAIVYYDPMLISHDEIVELIERNRMKFRVENGNIVKEIIEIPVLYGGEEGPDLPNIAEHNGITEEEVVAIHTSGEYLIYMLGFTPGFPYLGGMSKKIATPRLKTPRTKIPAGSVGIAGEQTGIYPLESPGGWQLLGRTPLELFNPQREKPFLLDAGKYIKFVQVDRAEYERISDAVKKGTYEIKTYRKEG